MNEFSLEKLYSHVNYCLECGNKLELQADREQKIRPFCPKCGYVFYKNPVPASACVVFDEDNRLLLIKRAVAPKIGEWALPSGYIEIEQSPEACAVQEMLEETGLNGEIDRFLGYFWGSSPLYTRILSFGFLMKNSHAMPTAGDDAAAAEFFSLDKLPDICFASHRYFIEEAKKYKGLV